MAQELPNREQHLALQATAFDATSSTPQDLRRSILIVDDDRCLRELLDIHLSNAGYSVCTAEDAVVAGRQILKEPPALIIMDADMPYMTGYEFASVLKADPRTCDIPFVFLSSDEDVADQASKLGAVAYLRKPVFADRLLEVVALYVS